jgi:hypothetical protein
MERREAFVTAWRRGDRDVLRLLDAISSYLRSAGHANDREVTEDTWLKFAVEAWALGD